MKRELTLFPGPGRKHTAATLRLALERVGRNGHVVVASTTGDTALKAARLAPGGVSVVCIAHHVGFREPGGSELSKATEKKLVDIGAVVLRTTHAFSGIERANRLKFGGLGPAETVAWTYRTFGEGTKVCVEIAVMALDAGLIPHGRDVVCVGGTGRGADTALVIRPAHSRHFYDTQVREIICKPRQWGKD